MSVTLTIKKVPEPLAASLRQRAERHRRSLQRELLTIIEAAVSYGYQPPASRSVAEPGMRTAGRIPGAVGAGGSARSRLVKPGKLSLAELWERSQRLGSKAQQGESAATVRRLRDERHGR